MGPKQWVQSYESKSMGLTLWAQIYGSKATGPNLWVVSGESALTTSAQGISEPRVAMMSQAKNKWLDHQGAGHLRGQSCEDVAVDSGLDHLPRASRKPEFRGCLRRKWPDHHGAGHLGIQSSEDVSS